MNTERRSQPKICLIAALSENRVIARDGKIPWQLPGDSKRYREKIDGRVIIAGRKTFDRTYRNDVSIVVTRQDDYLPPIPATIVHSVSDALRVAREKLADVRAEKRDEIFVIGGGGIFRQTIGTADKLYLTIIHQAIAGDTFFPDYSAFTRTVFEEAHEENGYHYTFLGLERALV
jgi:dihydrofolate reductase